MLERLSVEGQRAVRAAMAATDDSATTVVDLFEALLVPGTAAGAALAARGFDTPPVSARRRVAPGKTLTPALKAVLQRAAGVADETRRDVVTTGHLLIAVSESKDCPVPLDLSPTGELSSADETVPTHRRASRVTFRGVTDSQHFVGIAPRDH